MSTSGVFALVDGRKNTTSTSCTVSKPSWAQVYRDAATKCSLHKGRICTTSMQIRWWCFSFQQLAQILHLHSRWSSQLALVVFFLRALAHLLMHILQLALSQSAQTLYYIILYYIIYITMVNCNLHCIYIYTVQVAIYCTNVK